MYVCLYVYACCVYVFVCVCVCVFFYWRGGGERGDAYEWAELCTSNPSVRFGHTADRCSAATWKRGQLAIIKSPKDCELEEEKLGLRAPLRRPNFSPPLQIHSQIAPVPLSRHSSLKLTNSPLP